jgi:protein phosphatase
MVYSEKKYTCLCQHETEEDMKACSRTDIGKNREMNQDFLFVSETPVGSLPNLFVVADGMGGHNAGEFASRRSVEVIVEEVLKEKEKAPAALLEYAILKANQEILEAAQADEAKQGMGTTIVAVTIEDSQACIANVGDSRLYVVCNDGIRQITEDHSLVEEMVRKGELAREKAKEHPDKNIITRAVGVVSELQVDFFEVELHKEDKLLLCSDGLTNMVSEEQIAAILNSGMPLAYATEQLIDAANDNGGSDNITVIVVEPFSNEVKEC